MTDATSFLSASEQDEVVAAIRNGLQTLLDLEQPPVTIQVTRWNEAIGAWVTDPALYEVLLRYSNTQPGLAAGASAESSRTQGTIQAFHPLTLAVGNRVTLPNGSVATITPPTPHARYGIIRAWWATDEGV